MGKQGGWHHLKCWCVTRDKRLWSSVQNSKLVDTDLQMLSYLILARWLCCIIWIEECWKNVEKLEIHPPKVCLHPKAVLTEMRNVPSYLHQKKRFIDTYRKWYFLMDAVDVSLACDGWHVCVKDSLRIVSRSLSPPWQSTRSPSHHAHLSISAKPNSCWAGLAWAGLG